MPVSVAENVGVTPETKLLFKSFSVIVMIELATPSATMRDVPVMVEFKATAVPGVKSTLPSALITGVSIERIFVSAARELKVQVDIPEASVAEHDP